MPLLLGTCCPMVGIPKRSIPGPLGTGGGRCGVLPGCHQGASMEMGNGVGVLRSVSSAGGGQTI